MADRLVSWCEIGYGEAASAEESPIVSAKMVAAGEWVLDFAESYPPDLLVAAIYRAMHRAGEPAQETLSAGSPRPHIAGVPVGDAKRAIHVSDAWSGSRARDEEFHDALVRGLDQI